MKTIMKRRRLEAKTDYLFRRKLLVSNKPRMVVRKTNRYIISEYVISKEAKDSVTLLTNSRELLKHGWPETFAGSLKSIPASYLTGFLMGKKILEKDLEVPIMDFGMNRTIHKTKLFAFVKGLIDAGVEINCDEKTFPEEERIEGKNLKEDFSKQFKTIKSKIGKQ
jgi:large subunit ribosomal protein L18